MHFSSSIVLAILAATAAAKRCINATVPVTISARQGVFNLAVPQSNLEATDFLLNQTMQGRNFTNTVLTGYNTTSGIYNISTEFCMPTTGPGANATNPTVQVLTHGIGFDKTYWDLSFNNFNYSYVDVATDVYGYCTIAIDRLGIGNSSHGEPLNEIQAPLEVSATAALTRMLRNGTFPNVNHAFQKVVHVGHSFGSAQTYALANLYPNITDGIVLTGFSMNGSFANLFVSGGNFQQAYLNQPLRFSNLSGSTIQTFLSRYAEPLLDYLAPVSLDSLPPPQTYAPGYLVSSDVEANKYLFLKPHYFDPQILQVAEQTKQPVTEGEILTLTSLAMENAYAGPVIVIDGDSDLPYCGSDCVNTGGVAPSLAAMVKMNFPSVSESNFSSHIQPNTGHGINFHYNATGAYKVWLDFLGSKNLASTSGANSTAGRR